VDHASVANGALLKQFTCNFGAPNQQWVVQLETAANGSLVNKFVNVKSNKCMGVDRASTSSGANIGQYDCLARAPNQEWIGLTVSGGWLGLGNVKSGLCIRPDGGSTGNDVQLKQFACKSTDTSEHWGKR
jgi:hypothetical protein